MRASVIALATVPLLALADSGFVNTAWRHSRRAAKVVPRAQGYQLEDMYKGQSFLEYVATRVLICAEYRVVLIASVSQRLGLLYQS